MDAQDEFQRSGETVHATFDWGAVAPSTAVIEAVAFAVDRDPMDLDPLYDVIDFDAFDMLINPGQNSRSRSNISIAFVFSDQRITVHANGEVVVAPIETGS